MCELCGHGPGMHRVEKDREVMWVCLSCYLPLIADGWDN